MLYVRSREQVQLVLAQRMDSGKLNQCPRSLMFSHSQSPCMDSGPGTLHYRCLRCRTQ